MVVDNTSGLNKVTFAISANSAHVPFNSALIVTNGISINAASFSPYTGSVYTTMQPQGFTNLCGSAAPYLNYRVLGSKIGLKVIPLAIEDACVVSINQVSTGEQWNTSVWTGAEAPYSSKTMTFTSSEANRQLSQKFTSAEAFGVPEIAIRDGLEYAGSFNTSPENEWNWIVNIQSVLSSTTVLTGLFVEVQYDIEFFNPVTGGLNDVLLKRARLHDVASTPVEPGVLSSAVTPLSKDEMDYLMVGGIKTPLKLHC